MKLGTNSIFLLFILSFLSCNSNTDIETRELETTQDQDDVVKITSVTVSGNENKYNFSVGVKSPDKGCEQYANWWEVISEAGQLIYRRILAHSHINEQPFVRSGGIVAIKKNQVVIVRVHMNNTGYSVNSFKGSVLGGFNNFKTDANFAENLASQDPLPGSCPF